MKFSKKFFGVPNGEIYPVVYQKGDTVPPELEEAAMAVECVELKENSMVKNGRIRSSSDKSASGESNDESGND